MNVVSSITGVFTEVLEWFAGALNTVGNIFYVPETGLTFIGSISLIMVGIGLVTMLIAMVRSLIKGRG